ncbi:RTC4-like domain-containing protein [Xylaria sp. CBS 124048]|nr:RTC4-like domain-containing protein [Xylaria sp. CBS 124048]
MVKAGSMVSKKKSPRVGLSRKSYSGGAPLTQINGKRYQPPDFAKRPNPDSPASMNGDQDPEYDSITALPESSGDEAESMPSGQPILNNDQDSDEEYERRKAADIRKTTFPKTKSPRVFDTRSTPAIRVPRTLPSAERQSLLGSEIGEPHSLAGSKRPAGEDQSKGADEPGKDLDALRPTKKKVVTRYGSSSKTTRQNASQLKPFASKPSTKASTSRNKAQPASAVGRPFKHADSLSPDRPKSPRRPFKMKRDSSDFDALEAPTPRFKKVTQQSSSPVPIPEFTRHDSLIFAGSAEKENSKSTNTAVKGGTRKASRPSRRKSKRGQKVPPDPKPRALSPRPVFKMPEAGDLDASDDVCSLDATEASGTPDITYSLDVEEVESTKISRCPICHEEVDCKLLEKHSTNGKMSIKQQTAFCRLHKRESAVNAGIAKGYPKIDWEAMGDRCRVHQAFIRDILEGAQASHYRDVLKENVEAGKNRTLLKSSDNITPGYYGPRGLRVMTEFIMRTLSSVIRRRAVEDKLISARSYTGYVQLVLVPELAVRLIMDDMSVSKERAREVLEESAEIGELLYEEDRDVVRTRD